MKPSSNPVAARPRALPFLALAALGVLTLAGCKGVTPIKEVLDDPSRFTSKQVRIAGDVTNSVGVLGVGAYRVNDGTGTITVVSQTNGVPREGAKVGVKGMVKVGYTLGSESLTVLMEDERYTP
jgi:hypothetical protein